MRFLETEGRKDALTTMSRSEAWLPLPQSVLRRLRGRSEIRHALGDQEDDATVEDLIRNAPPRSSHRNDELCAWRSSRV